jgi:hypothetical protein
MTDNGFILLSRSILNSDVFASQKLLKIWIWCLCKANFKDRTIPLKVGKGERLVKVKRGSFIFGRFKAEEELFIDGSTVYKLIHKLKELEMIQIGSNNQYSIISICNYDTYQDASNYEVTTKEQPSNNQVTTKEQPSNTTNKVNNVKESKEEKEPIFNFKKSLLDLGIEKQVVEDWLKVRKTKKATNTETAFLSIKKNIEKCSMSANDCIKHAVEKSWAGFKLEWISNLNGSEVKKYQTPSDLL